MKQSFFSFLAGIATMILVYYLISCNSSSSREATGTDTSGIKKMPLLAADTGCKEWREIMAMANSYQINLQQLNQLRVNKNMRSNDDELISQAIGEAYMESYRNSVGPSNKDALSIVLTKEALAFYLKYLFDHPNQNEILAGFGRYDRNLLALKKLTDPKLEGMVSKPNDRNTHLTLIFGEKGDQRPASYIKPLIIGTDLMYDDWHDEWP